MKINSKIISISCIVIIIFLIIGKSGLYQLYPDYSYGLDSYSIDESRLDSIDLELRTAQQKLDDINRVKRIHIDGYDGYRGTVGGWLGLIETYRKDGSVRVKDPQEYLVLSNVGFKIQEQEGPKYLTFYSRNGLSYISKTKLNTNGKNHNVSYVDRIVNYKYSSRNNAILLPIDSDFWKVLITVFTYAVFILISALYFYVILAFFKFLIAISKNNIFDERIVNKLKVMGICFFILGAVNYFINLIIYFSFQLVYSDPDVVITYSLWKYDYLMFIFSAGSYLVFTVFKKAMFLQQEQNLTI